MSDINTDHIKSLLECIQAVSEVTTLSIIIIIIGVVIFVFAALGFFGAYSKRKYILVEVSKILQLKIVLFMVLSVVFSWYRTGFNNKNGNLLFNFMIVNQRNGHCDLVCIVNLSLFWVLTDYISRFKEWSIGLRLTLHETIFWRGRFEENKFWCYHYFQKDFSLFSRKKSECFGIFYFALRKTVKPLHIFPPT